MGGRSSADAGLALVRSAGEHARLIEALSAQHPVLDAGGFEHHLFVVGDSVLKVYRWFRTAELRLPDELALRAEQQRLHQVYAPALAAEVVGLDGAGRVCPLDSDAVRFAGLSMGLGQPLGSDWWQRPGQARSLGARVGGALARCHQRAPEVEGESAERASALERLLLDACRVSDGERHRVPDAPRLLELVASHARALAAQAAVSSRAAARALAHGDLNLGNVVVAQEELQFVDPGVAMAAGVGLVTDTPFTAGWDVALMGQSLALMSGTDPATYFVRSYAGALALQPAALAPDLRYWRALTSILTMAATLRYASEIRDPERAFAPRARPGFRLETYVEWLARGVLYALEAPPDAVSSRWPDWPDGGSTPTTNLKDGNVSDDDIKKPLLDLYEHVINNNDVAAMDRLYGPGYVNHAAPFGLAQDFEGLRKLFVEFVEAFPDQHIVADDIIVQGDKVVCRWTLTATHKGTFFGVPATGRKVVMTGIDIERIANGKIVEHWGGEDMLGLLEQIGAVKQLRA